MSLAVALLNQSFFIQLRDAAPIRTSAIPSQSLGTLEKERGRTIGRTEIKARSEGQLGGVPVLRPVSEQSL